VEPEWVVERVEVVVVLESQQSLECRNRFCIVRHNRIHSENTHDHKYHSFEDHSVVG
jgi:aspartate carbamoyltransferase regulatory subunit